MEKYNNIRIVWLFEYVSMVTLSHEIDVFVSFPTNYLVAHLGRDMMSIRPVKCMQICILFTASLLFSTSNDWYQQHLKIVKNYHLWSVE